MKLAWLIGFWGTCLGPAAAGCTSDDGDSDGNAGTGGTSGSTGGTAGKSSGGSSNAGGKSSGGATSGGAAGATSGGAAGTTGGAGGASGSAGSGGAAGSAGGSCCVAAPLSWGPDGGNGLYTDQNTLSPCASYTRERTPRVTDPPTLSCTQDLGGCDVMVSGADVDAALTHADVTTAIADAPVLYGCDSRPVDGQVLRIEIGQAVIEVGSEGCGGIPEGVAALAELLRDLETEQRSRGECATTFPL